MKKILISWKQVAINFLISLMASFIGEEIAIAISKPSGK